MAGLRDFFLGTPQTTQQIPRFSPEQSQAMNQLLSQAMGGLQQQPRSFEPYKQQAQERFATQTVPGLAERLGQLGGESKYSSNFQGALLGAGAGLDRGLAQQEQDFNQQQFQNSLQLLQGGLQPQFDTGIQPQTQGLLQPLAASGGQAAGLMLLLKLLGGLGGGALGGPGGAMAGSSLGSSLGSLFGGGL